MATIINIETSGSTCSAALTAEGMILAHREEFEGRNHATLLSGFIKDCLDHAREHEMKIDAVAVSLGPGSYTGLRIGLSEAKGLAYSLDAKLIGVDTLQLLATRVMFSVNDIDPETIFVPMIDARRMEVYTAAYDFALSELMKPQALILEGDAYEEILATGRPVLFFGSGAEKAVEFFGKAPQAQYVPGVDAVAVDMIALAERAWATGDFLDLAYSTPLYIKDFQATKPKNKVISKC
ncbi:MAG: tRNA (adenosine(37)-N6)-threonylcarbamoyltransferase complex dimerization subunit type 1 TsaB [Muribaculaceae bacterium]|nr:tRNA (adenosine(37)-N6)-threonylcarbamoyltransferase complex dimerization subunit type 1 TsaB [Muribaculaceae bacterium]